MRTTSRWWIALSITLAGCGASAATGAGKPESAPTYALEGPDAYGSEGPEAYGPEGPEAYGPEGPEAHVPGASARQGGERAPYPANPVLSVYVQGPTPAGERSRGPGPREFATDLVVVNTGDAPVDIADARARFDAWRGDDRRECETTSGGPELRGPPTLGPGEAITYRALATCWLAKPGRYEVRAYLSFGADAPGFHRERHYVGRYYAEVPAGP